MPGNTTNQRPVSGGGKSGAKNTSFTNQRKLSSMKSNEFTLRSNFDRTGYRNREDITILPPGILVTGSYNVLTNTSGRIGVTKGYTLDGQADPALVKISSSFDFTKILSNDRHLRSRGQFLQFRYVYPDGTIVWRAIYDALVPNAAINYVSYWDEAELTTVCLFVQGTPAIFRWTGAVGIFASTTSTTLTIQGPETIAQLGFDTAAGSNLFMNGIEYTYTGTSGNTFTGMVPDPTLGSLVVGDPVPQGISATPNSSMTTISPTFNNGLIGNLDNQIFIGALDSSVIYTSKVNNYLDYSSGVPRLVGDGNVATILDYPTAFINQDDVLQVSAGKDIWYQTLLTDTTNSVFDTTTNQTVTTVYETLVFKRLKTTALQGAQSQAVTTKIKNNIAFLSFEPIVNTLGTVQDYLNSPQTSDLSYSIVNDMNAYDFTDAAMIYHRQFLYLSVPKEGLIRIYNMTNQDGDIPFYYWEAPVTFPIGRFAIIDDELYGHGYNVAETYKLFDGYEFNNHPIPARAMFSFEQYGTRTYPKVFNLFYMEGYITSNCTLNYGFNYDIDGCARQRLYDIKGTQTPLVCARFPDASLGKDGLGKRPLSGLIPDASNTSPTGLPPKFRAIKQVSELPFYELQVFFESQGSGQQWEILAFGPAAKPASEGNNSRQY